MEKFYFIFFLLCFEVLCDIKVFFTPSAKTYSELISLLNSANKSIHIATFSIQPDFLNFLKNKNIDIKIICEYGDSEIGKIKKIENKKGIFHTKFIVIDEKKVIIMSANLTFSNFYKNYNNILFIDDISLAKFLTEKFNSYWNENIYTNFYDSEEIKIRFSPENDCFEFLTEEIGNSKSSIYFATYEFTDKKLAEKLIEKRRENIIVRGIIENNNIVPNSVYFLLLSYGCDIKKSCSSGLLHNKFFIIDMQKIITGSYNPSLSAKKNNEIMILIKNKDIAEKFYKEWRKLFYFNSLRD